jgi:hypothetical protein
MVKTETEEFLKEGTTKFLKEGADTIAVTRSYATG